MDSEDEASGGRYSVRFVVLSVIVVVVVCFLTGVIVLS